MEITSISCGRASAPDYPRSFPGSSAECLGFIGYRLSRRDFFMPSGIFHPTRSRGHSGPFSLAGSLCAASPVPCALNGAGGVWRGSAWGVTRWGVPSFTSSDARRGGRYVVLKERVQPGRGIPGGSSAEGRGVADKSKLTGFRAAIPRSTRFLLLRGPSTPSRGPETVSAIPSR